MYIENKLTISKIRTMRLSDRMISDVEIDMGRARGRQYTAAKLLAKEGGDDRFLRIASNPSK